jgi:spore germination cell wall hydrolase CwlJ-like protein
MLLARLGFSEAPSEGPVGQAAVMWVALNRVGGRGFAGTLEGVIYQRNQFVAVNKNPRSLWNRFLDPWSLPYDLRRARDQALDVAAGVTEGRIVDLTSGRTFFHSGPPSPWFQKRIGEGVLYDRLRIGGHFFYRSR